MARSPSPFQAGPPSASRPMPTQMSLAPTDDPLVADLAMDSVVTHVHERFPFSSPRLGAISRVPGVQVNAGGVRWGVR